MKEKNKKNLFWIICLVNIGVLLFGLAGLMMSPMLFDAPGSMDHMMMQIIFALIVLIPIVTLICMILSLVFYKRKFIRALKVSFVPLILTVMTYFIFWLQDLMS